MLSRVPVLRFMRFVVVGAGAIGGVLGGRLHQHGHEVVLVARGEHLDAIRERGLQVDGPEDSCVLRIPVFDSVATIELTPDDVVLLCVKGQDTSALLDDLAISAPPHVPIVCVQNGVANERAALRHFEHVYGVCVVCPAVHLDPGVVQANAAPVTGILDVGRYPDGVDDNAAMIAAAFASSTFSSEPRADIMRWKYGKLLNNLGNALDALLGPEQRGGELNERVRAEGVAALAAAGITAVSRDEDRARRGDLFRWGGTASRSRPGASSWQSLARGTGTIEADYLNGEVVLLGRLHGVPTPVNATLQRLANEAAHAGTPPGSLTPDDVLRAIAA